MPKQKGIDDFRRATARRLRANTTDAEMKLWRYLKRMEINGSHFRRQVPVGPYVADFACLASRLVVEPDGSQHGESANPAKDDRRTLWLESEGYRVLRFWNNDIVENLDGVLDTIHAALYGSRDLDSGPMKHLRRTRLHPTPARGGRRPAPTRGG
jgi:very-short-patch-repair endonuclease